MQKDHREGRGSCKLPQNGPDNDMEKERFNGDLEK